MTAPAAAGDVLLHVPLDRCLLVDYAGAGLRLPSGQWPRLRKGVQKDDALPWDVLQARLSFRGAGALESEALGGRRPAAHPPGHPLCALAPPRPQALALLDALAGGGDAFWERYTAEVLPAPLALTLPLCFPPELLPELQHGAVIRGAQAQQQRLAALFPGLSGAMCAGALGRGLRWSKERVAWHPAGLGQP